MTTDTDWGYTGDNLLDEAEKADKKNQKGDFAPFRFWLKAGDEADIIILDASISKGLAFWEHNLKIDGKFGNFVGCCHEFAPCPVCKNTDNKPYFVLMLTILDLRPYTNKHGDTVPYTRKLLPVKKGSRKELVDIEKFAMKQYGTLRGTLIRMKRGHDEKEAGIGTPSMFEGWDGGRPVLFEQYDEDGLIEYFGHQAVLDRNGQVVIPENGKLQAYNYREIFKKPDPDEIRQRFGWAAPAGSRQFVAESTAAPARRRAEAPAAPPARRPAPKAAEGDDIPMNYESADALPSAASTPPPARRRVAPPPVAKSNDDDESPFDED